MRRLNLFTCLALITIISLTAVTGCIKVGAGAQQTSSLVSDATLATGVDSASKPLNASRTFYVTTQFIYLSLKLNSAPANTQVTAKMSYLSGEDAGRANTLMYYSSQQGQGTQYLSFAMQAPPGGFPQGDYQLSVTAGGKEQAALPFNVLNPGAQQGLPHDAGPARSGGTVNAGAAASGPAASGPAVSGPAVSGPAISGPTASGGADLVITEAWLEGPRIYYRIKNAGSVDTPPTYTYLYVNNLLPPLGSSSFVDVLKPGQEKVLNFSSYQWPYGADTDGDSGASSWNSSMDIVYDPSLKNHTVKICADAKDEARESNENNNCLYKIWGSLWDFDLLAVSHLADYYNSSAKIFKTEGLNESDQKGAHIKMSDGGLEMVPEAKPQGWFRGKWGVTSTDTNLKTGIYPIKVPQKLKFKATVGLSSAAQGSDGVTFKFGFQDSSDALHFLGEKKMTVPGQFEEWVINMDDLYGSSGFFVLQVDAGNSPTNDFAIWKQARVMQVSD